MKIFILQITLISIFAYCCVSQTIRKPVDISNDYYRIRISKGSGKFEDSMVTKEKYGKDFFNFENVNLEKILERVFPNVTQNFKSNKYADEPLNIDIYFYGMSLEEFQPLFIQQISNYFLLDIEIFNGISEKWKLRIQDSQKLSSHFFNAKQIQQLENNLRCVVNTDNNSVWEIEKATFTEFSLNLSQLIRMPIDCEIELERDYTFKLMITKPFNYENIRIQLENFGFQVISEKYNNKILEISTKK